MLCVWILGSAAIFWFCKTLKKVVIDYSGKLLVSNYFKVIEVRVEDIKSISESTNFFHPAVLWFTLRKPSEFGERIIFMPRVILGYFRPHPIHKELQDFVSLSQDA
jgi:hypothetical protein